MRKTLEDILKDVGASIDQDTTLPTGTELIARAVMVDKALEEWGNAYEWDVLRISNHVPAFTNAGTSVGLPVNFKKPMSPVIDVSKTTDNKYSFIEPEDRFLKVSTDKYAYITGNDAVGFALNLNPAMASGASLAMDYLSFPSSMATLQDVSVCKHPEFLVKRTEAFILEARSDPRFPQAEDKAAQALERYIEDEDSKSRGQKNEVPDRYKQASYRIGEE